MRTYSMLAAATLAVAALTAGTGANAQMHPGDRGQQGPGPGYNDRGPGDRGPGDRGPGDRGRDGRGFDRHHRQHCHMERHHHRQVRVCR